jgi:hypothetical protein
MEREYKISSLTLLLAIIGSLFTFAALQKLIGNTIAFSQVLNERDLTGSILIFIISWTATLTILIFASRMLRTGYNFKTSMTIGVIIGSILLPIISTIFSPTILFGSVQFDFNGDYMDILRNMTTGTISIIMCWKWERQHST